MLLGYSKQNAVETILCHSLQVPTVQTQDYSRTTSWPSVQTVFQFARPVLKPAPFRSAACTDRFQYRYMCARGPLSTSSGTSRLLRIVKAMAEKADSDEVSNGEGLEILVELQVSHQRLGVSIFPIAWPQQWWYKGMISACFKWSQYCLYLY